MSVSIDIDGFDELEQQLKELEMITQKRVLRSAMRRSAQPVYGAIVANARARWGEKSGVTQESIKLRVKFPKNAKWADVIAEVGVFRIRRLELIADDKMPAPQKAYWLEHGTQPHALGKGANLDIGKNQDVGLQHPGTPAKPVIRPAMDAQVSNALSIQKEFLGQAIDRAIKKQGRK